MQGEEAVPDVQPHGDPRRPEELKCLRDQGGCVDHRTAKDDPRDFEVADLTEALLIPDPAAELDPDVAPDPGDDPADQRPILTVAEGAVEVHQMEPPGPLHDEALGQGDRVVFMALGRRRALREAHGAAEADVNGGEEIHGALQAGRLCSLGTPVLPQGCCARDCAG